MTEQPLLYRWDGEGLRPAGPYWNRKANEQLVVGEQYQMVAYEERSANSHRHYFACINEAWQSLPEHLTERFPSPEHLRKFALIHSGFRDERTYVCRSRSEALRLAAFLRPIDDFAAVTVSGPLVVMLTAKSQSLRAMDRKTFGASKTAVLDVLADLIGTTPEALGRNAA